MGGDSEIWLKTERKKQNSPRQSSSMCWIMVSQSFLMDLGSRNLDAVLAKSRHCWTLLRNSSSPISWISEFSSGSLSTLVGPEDWAFWVGSDGLAWVNQKTLWYPLSSEWNRGEERITVSIEGNKYKVGGHVAGLTGRRCRFLMNRRLGSLIRGTFNLYRFRDLFVLIGHFLWICWKDTWQKVILVPGDDGWWNRYLYQEIRWTGGGNWWKRPWGGFLLWAHQKHQMDSMFE